MDIRCLVNDMIKKYHTRNPFEMVKEMNVILIYAPLSDVRGFYQYFQRNNIIYINENLAENHQKLVCAHELGHMLMHKKSNAIYLDTRTEFNTTKFEIEANQFAIELLVSDEEVFENKDLTTEQFARLIGYDQKLIELRIKHNRE